MLFAMFSQVLYYLIRRNVYELYGKFERSKQWKEQKNILQQQAICV